MDRRTLLALALSFLILVLYPHYIRWITPKSEGLTEPAELLEIEKNPVAAAESAQPAVEESAFYAEDTTAGRVSEQTEQIENSKLSAVFTNVGGGIRRLTSFTQRNGKTEETLMWDIPETDPPAFAMFVPGEASGLERALFGGPTLLEGGTKIEFVHTLPSELRIAKRYEVLGEEAAIRLTIEVSNPSTTPQPFFFELGSELHEGPEDARFGPRALASYVKSGEEVTKTGAGKLKKKGSLKEAPLQWAGLSKRYFIVLVKPEAETALDQFRASAEAGKLKSAVRVPTHVIQPKDAARYEFLVYAGPTTRATLKSFGAGFEDILAAGFWGFFKTIMLAMLGFFYTVSKNYGIAIILISIAIKVIFWPLTQMSFESMRKLQDLSPKIKNLQAQHKENPERMNKEMIELYKRHKVNPLGGCLPMVIQIPVFFALYEVLVESVELRGAHFFGWVKDLSEPDVLYTLPYHLPVIGNAISLLPILMIISMVWQQRLQPQTQTSPEQQQVFKFMPIIFGFIFYKLPSGLVLYWTTSNLLGIFHQLIVHRNASAKSGNSNQ